MDPVFSVDEAVKRPDAPCGETKAREEIRAGRLRAFRCGRSLLIRESAWLEWLANLPPAASPEQRPRRRGDEQAEFARTEREKAPAGAISPGLVRGAVCADDENPGGRTLG